MGPNGHNDLVCMYWDQIDTSEQHHWDELEQWETALLLYGKIHHPDLTCLKLSHRVPEGDLWVQMATMILYACIGIRLTPANNIIGMNWSNGKRPCCCMGKSTTQI